MLRSLFQRLAVLALCVGLPGAAAAVSFNYTFDRSVEGTQGNNSAGLLERIDGVYDDQTEVFSWGTTFSEFDDRLPDGMWLVVSDGPNPKGVPGELAIMYVDGLGGDVFVYEYNGQNSSSSFTTQPRIQTFDDVVHVTGDDEERRLEFQIDVSFINDFMPQVPADGGWDGIRFAEQIGIWMHPVSGLKVRRHGPELTKFRFKVQGWYDVADRPTTPVPEPSSALLLGLAVILLGGAISYARFDQSR